MLHGRISYPNMGDPAAGLRERPASGEHPPIATSSPSDRGRDVCTHTNAPPRLTSIVFPTRYRATDGRRILTPSSASPRSAERRSTPPKSSPAAVDIPVNRSSAASLMSSDARLASVPVIPRIFRIPAVRMVARAPSRPRVTDSAVRASALAIPAVGRPRFAKKRTRLSDHSRVRLAQILPITPPSPATASGDAPARCADRRRPQAGTDR